MRWLVLVLCFLSWSALAAPPDDGATSGQRVWVINQARSAVTITPSNTTDLTIKPTRALFVGDATACNIAVRMADDGSNVTILTNVQSGAMLPLQVNRVMATSTTCATIIGFY